MLSPEEKKWLARVQRALDACPSDDIGFYTIGDDDLTVYRVPVGDFSETSEDFCFAVNEADAHLASLKFPRQVHSTAG